MILSSYEYGCYPDLIEVTDWRFVIFMFFVGLISGFISGCIIYFVFELTLRDHNKRKGETK